MEKIADNKTAGASALDKSATETTTTGPKCKVTLKKRIVYNMVSTGTGSSAETWYRILYSSSKIESSKYTVTSLKMETVLRGYGCSNRNVHDIRYRSFDKKGKNNIEPVKGKSYVLDSPTSLWFNEFYHMYCETTTTIVYRKNGSIDVSYFHINLPV